VATIYYASINDYSTGQDVAHAGTSSTAGDVIELRMGNGTVAPTRDQVILGLKVLLRWLSNGGLNSAGANIPRTADGLSG